jgi:putative ABC transport system permease protein
LRLLGYSRWQLLRSFLLESLLIAALGGLLGCAIGSLADGLSATSLVSNGPGGGKSVVLRLAVDLRILGAGMLLALTMGVLGGVLPSLAAMRTRPLQALR